MSESPGSTQDTPRTRPKMRWWRRTRSRVATYFYSLWLSPFRRLLLVLGVALLIAFAFLFVFVVVLSGFQTAYELTLGLSSAFSMEQHGSLARSLGGVLGVFGWIALPTMIGIFAGGIFGRRLEAMKEMSPEEIRRQLFGDDHPPSSNP
ncbi:hypothetical protein [Streptomyces sp. NPDC059649]|uniref:hypothetical protein n=1 Tax=Streptomyces sp. NPDC059649 TaxID=3346895 RepID=UPI0036834A2B